MVNREQVASDQMHQSILSAWADIDRLQTLFIKTPEKRDDRWMVAISPARPWPHRTSLPTKASGRNRLADKERAGSQIKKPALVTKGRVYVSAFDGQLLADSIDDVLGHHSFRLETVGIGSGYNNRRPKAQINRTCRAFFDIDNDGLPIVDSFGHSPLPDLVDIVSRLRDRGEKNPEDAIRRALPLLNGVEQRLCEAFVKSFEHAEKGESSFEAAMRAVAALAVEDDEWPWLSDHSSLSNWSYNVWTTKPDDLQFDLLESFFRQDLQRAATDDNGLALRRYLSGAAASERRHDLADRQHLEPLLDPALLPRASWPSEFKPRLSQQLAVTLAMHRLTHEGVLAVNGPPGTGKTTLLRDFYANVVFDRACAMAEIDKPNEAFQEIKDPCLTGYDASVFSVPASITGREMLLTSMNNEALENVTREIPIQKAIDERYESLFAYFRDSANWSPPPSDEQVASRAMDADPSELNSDMFEAETLWGFAAGIAGNKKNLNQLFTKLGVYAKQDHGGLLRELSGGKGDPPAWEVARREFVAARDVVENLVSERVKYWKAIRRLGRLDVELPQAKTEADNAANSKRELARSIEDCDARVREIERKIEKVKKSLLVGEGKAPGLWKRVFDFSGPDQWSVWRRLIRSWKHEQWRRRMDDTEGKRVSLVESHGNLLTERKRVEEELARAERHVWESSERFQQLVNEQAKAREDAQTRPGDAVVDEGWWSRSLDERKRGTAWIDGEFHEAQVRLFAASVNVHEVFLRQAGARVAHNIRRLKTLVMEGMSNEQKALVALPAWQTLFLVMPMVSTTFASVQRMLGDLPSQTIGHLIVDEAGQAVPYAAVGALSRAKTALVVGDPDQLEPVVTLHEGLIDSIIAAHKAPSEVSPHVTSVQKLTDAASRWGTVRHEKWIGVPLQVHQRCLDPMFSIVHDMLYKDMVQGRTHGPKKRYAQELSESEWIDIPHGGGKHWNPADWDPIAVFLDKLPWSDWSKVPSVGMISPFKDVVDELRDRCRQFVDANNMSWDKRMETKLKVGTVHTFQGQEREIIWLVLGGDPDRQGAINWVTQTPNLLNVAVTRAQDRLYVVGDMSNWLDSNNAKFLSHHLLNVSAN